MHNKYKGNDTNLIVNHQDLVPLYLVFMGVSMKNKLNEIINLKWSHIDLTNKVINIIDTKTNKVLKQLALDDADVNILKEVQKERNYFRHVFNKGKIKVYKLDLNDYVVKNYNYPTRKMSRINVSPSTIMNRIYKFKKDISNLKLQDNNKINLLCFKTCELSSQFEMLDNIFSIKENQNDLDNIEMYIKVKNIWSNKNLDAKDVEKGLVYDLKKNYLRYKKLKNKFYKKEVVQ